MGLLDPKMLSPGSWAHFRFPLTYALSKFKLLFYCLRNASNSFDRPNDAVFPSHVPRHLASSNVGPLLMFNCRHVLAYNNCINIEIIWRFWERVWNSIGLFRWVVGGG